MAEAPEWMSAEAAYGWQCGYDAALAAARAVIAERPDVIEAARAAVAHDCATGTQAVLVALVDAIGDEPADG